MEEKVKSFLTGGCVKSSKIELNYKFSSAQKLINQCIALGGICNSAVKIDFLLSL